VIDVVNAEQPSLPVLMGAIACEVVPAVYARRHATWKEWDEIGRNSDFPSIEFEAV
jgi:hypothetical protein